VDSAIRDRMSLCPVPPRTKRRRRLRLIWDIDVASEAPACPKSTALLAKAEALKNAAGTCQLTSTWTPEHAARDVSGSQPLSCAALLDFTSEQPTATMPSVVQILWAHVDEPEPEDQILEKSGQRLWYIASARDVSGAASLGVTEKCAFKLSSVAGLVDFQTKHQQGALNMPLFCHMRVSRSLRGDTAGASQPSASDIGAFPGAAYVSHVLEDVEPVTWDPKSAPNASYNDVLHILNNCPGHDEGILFAFLGDIQPCPYYGFKVKYNEVEAVKAMYVAALISSPSKSQTESVGSGYKVTTTGIIDLANPDAPQAEPYTVTGYCGLDNVLDFKLDPPRGKAARAAVILITQKDSTGFQVQKLEYVEPDDTKNAIACFQKLRTLSKKVHPVSSEKRSHSLGDLFVTSPADTKRCRTLRAAPTDASLQDDDPPSAK
jgi:hypothetical protein